MALITTYTQCHWGKIIRTSYRCTQRQGIQCTCAFWSLSQLLTVFCFIFLNKIKLTLVNMIFFFHKQCYSQWLILSSIKSVTQLSTLLRVLNKTQKCTKILRYTLNVLEHSLLDFPFWHISTVSICYNSHLFCQWKDVFNHPSHIMQGNLLERINRYAFSCDLKCCLVVVKHFKV